MERSSPFRPATSPSLSSARAATRRPPPGRRRARCIIPSSTRSRRHHTVLALDLPGFGRSDRPAWMRTVSQLATLTGHIIDALDVGPCPLVGLGFGGWVAADLATRGRAHRAHSCSCRRGASSRRSGEIADYVLFELAEWAARGFHDPEIYVALCGEEPPMDLLRAWDAAREIGHRDRLEADRPQPAVATDARLRRRPHARGVGRRGRDRAPPDARGTGSAALPDASSAVHPRGRSPGRPRGPRPSSRAHRSNSSPAPNPHRSR